MVWWTLSTQTHSSLTSPKKKLVAELSLKGTLTWLCDIKASMGKLVLYCMCVCACVHTSWETWPLPAHWKGEAGLLLTSSPWLKSECLHCGTGPFRQSNRLMPNEVTGLINYISVRTLVLKNTPLSDCKLGITHRLDVWNLTLVARSHSLFFPIISASLPRAFPSSGVFRNGHEQWESSPKWSEPFL